MKVTLDSTIKGVMCASLLCVPSICSSIGLTFEGKYDIRSVIDGPVIEQDLSFLPLSFRFQVNFDPSITSLKADGGNFPGDETEAPYSRYSNDTTFGQPTISVSPVSSLLGSDLSIYYGSPFSNQAVTYANQGVYDYDGIQPNYGYNVMGFIFYYSDGNNSYSMGVKLTPPAPEEMEDVHFSSSQEFMSYLQSTEYQGVLWEIREVGLRLDPYFGGTMNTGSAKLVGIDGGTLTTSIPEPGSLALFMTGLGLMGVMGSRRKTYT